MAYGLLAVSCLASYVALKDDATATACLSHGLLTEAHEEAALLEILSLRFHLAESWSWCFWNRLVASFPWDKTFGGLGVFVLYTFCHLGERVDGEGKA